MEEYYVCMEEYCVWTDGMDGRIYCTWMDIQYIVIYIIIRIYVHMYVYNCARI